MIYFAPLLLLLARKRVSRWKVWPLTQSTAASYIFLHFSPAQSDNNIVFRCEGQLMLSVFLFLYTFQSSSSGRICHKHT